MRLVINAVFLDALTIFRLAFVAALFGVVQPIGDRRFGIALRVGDAAVMRSVGARRSPLSRSPTLPAPAAR